MVPDAAPASENGPRRSPTEVIDDLYERFEQGDIEGILDLCDPDIVITQDPALPWGGRHEGHAGVGHFALALVGTIDSTVTRLAVFGAEDRVVQYGRTKGTVHANGAPFDIPETHVWTVRGGLVTGAEFYIDSDAMLAALGAPERS